MINTSFTKTFSSKLNFMRGPSPQPSNATGAGAMSPQNNVSIDSKRGNFMTRRIFWLGYFIAALSMAGFGQSSQAIDFGGATPYGGFFFENFTANNSDTEGRLAVGGTCSLNNYGIGNRLDAQSAGDALLVQGNLAFPNGSVHYGNILVGGNGSAVGSSVIDGLAPGATFNDHTEMPIDFDQIESHLKDLSQTLTTLTPNTTFEFQWGGFQLHGDGISEVQVFNLDGEDVKQAHTFNVDQIPEGAWVVFNIDGNAPGLTNMSIESLAPHRSRVLFNFFEADNVQLRQINVQGSVLAPYAHVANPQGQINGQIAAKSWNGPMQINWAPFEGYAGDGGNQNPQFTSTPIIIATENQTYSYQATATDPDGDTLQFSVLSGPAGLTIDLMTGLVTWTPAQAGSEPVELRVSDGQGGSATQTFTISVVPAPTSGDGCVDLGVAAPYNGFFFEDFSAPSSDTEGRLAAGGHVSINNYSVGDKLNPETAGDVLVVGGDLTFPSGRVYYGNILVGGSAAGVGAPVINGLDPDAVLMENATLPVDFAQAEIDLKARSEQLQNLAANGSFDFRWGGLYLEGDGTSELQVFQLDGAEVLSAHTFDVTGIPNGAWVVFNISGTQTGLTNMSLSSLQTHRRRVLFNFYEATELTLNGIGVEGSILAPWAVVNQPQGVIAGQIIAKSWNGIMQLNHHPLLGLDLNCDGNQPPEFTSTPVENATALESYTYLATAEDPDGDSLTFALGSGPEGLIIDSASGMVTWTPTEAQVGAHAVQLTVTDPDGLTATQDFTVTVADPENRAPEFTSTPITTAQALELYSYQASANDPDGDVLTYAIALAPDGLVIDTATGLVTWTPDEAQQGQHLVQLAVADPDGLTATQDFTVTVADPENRAPEFTSTPITTAQALVAYNYQAQANDPDGDTLTFTLVSGPEGLAIDASTGLVSWTPTEAQVGDHAVQLAVADPDGLTATQDFNVTVTGPENRAPEFTSTPITTAQALAVYSYQAQANDPDGDSLTFTLVSGPEGLAIDASTGLVSWTPTEAQVGDHAVQLAVADPDGLTATQDFAVTVTDPENRAPEFTSTPVTTAQSLAEYSYQATADDPDGDSLTFTLVSGPEGLAIDASTGLVTWTPTEAQVGDHAVQLAVADPGGLTATQDFAVTVTEPENRAPEFTSTPVTTAQALAEYSYQATADDPDGDTLTFTLVSGPEGLAIDASTGLVTWTPTETQVGAHSVQLAVADPDGLTATQDFTVTVTDPENRAPEFTSTPVTTAQALVAFSYQATADDPDGDTLTFTLVSGPEGLAIDASTGLVSWTPTEAQVGDHAVQLAVADPDGLTATQDFAVTVTDPENRAPEFTSTPITTAQALAVYSYQAEANDPDGDTLSFTLVSGPEGLAIDASTGLVSWTPTETQVGDHAVQLAVADPDGLTATQDFNVTVTEPENRAPEFTSTPVTMAQALAEYSYQAQANDPDGDSLTFTLVSGPEGLAIDAGTGLVTWTPTEAQVGDHAVQLTVTDPDGLTATQDFTVTVTEPENRAPEFTSTPVTTAQALAEYSYQAEANDPDGDTLTFTLVSGPEGLAIDASTGLVSWTPTEAQVGDHAVQLAVADPDGLTATQDFAVTVTEPENRAPEFTSTPVTTAQALVAYNYQAQANDPDGDTLTFTLVSAPEGFAIDASTGLVTWTPTEAQVGDHAVQLAVADPDGLTDNQDFNVTVTEPANRPPAITSTPILSGFAERVYSYTITAKDPENDTLTFALVSGPDGMTVDPATGELQWTPTLEQLGVHPVSVSAADPTNDPVLQDFDLEVIEYDPTLDQFEIAWDQPAQGFLTADLDIGLSGQVVLGEATSISVENQDLQIDGNLFSGTLALPDEGMVWLKLDATSTRNHQVNLRRHVVVDRTGPEIAVDGGLSQTGTGSNITLRGTVSDTWDSSPSVAVQDHPDLGTFTSRFAFEDLDSDLFPLTLVATDHLGNTSQATVNWNSNPDHAVSVVLRSDPAVGNAGQIVVLEAEAQTDGLSPITQVQLYQLVEGETVLLAETNRDSLSHPIAIPDFSPAGEWQFKATARTADGSSGEQTYTLPIGGDLLLEGRVYDAATGHPLPNATLRLFPDQTTLQPDATGAYRLWRNNYVSRITVSAPGFVPVQLEGPFTAGSVLRLPDARLTPQGAGLGSGATQQLEPSAVLAATANPDLAAAIAANFTNRSQLTWNSGGAAITSFSNQALPLGLPLGWQPHTAFHTGEAASGSGTWDGPMLPGSLLVSSTLGEPGWVIEADASASWSLPIQPNRSYAWVLPDVATTLQPVGEFLQQLPEIGVSIAIDEQGLSLRTDPETSLARSGIQSVAIFDHASSGTWSGQRVVMMRSETYSFNRPDQGETRETTLPQQAVLYRVGQGQAQAILPLVPRQDSLLNQVQLAEIGGPAQALTQRSGHWIGTDGWSQEWSPGWEFSVQSDQRFWLRLEPANAAIPAFENWDLVDQFTLDMEQRSASPIFSLRRSDPTPTEKHFVLLKTISNAIGARYQVAGTLANNGQITLLQGETWESGHYVLMSLDLPPVLGQVSLSNGQPGDFRARNTPLGGRAPGWLALTPGRHFLSGMADNLESGELELQVSGEEKSAQNWTITTVAPRLELLRSDPISGLMVDLSPQFYLEFNHSIELTSVTPSSLALTVNGEARLVDWIWERGNQRALGRLASQVENPGNSTLEPGDSLVLSGSSAITATNGLSLIPFSLNFSVPLNSEAYPLNLDNLYIVYDSSNQRAQIRANGPMGPVGTTAYFNNGLAGSSATAVETGSPQATLVNLPGQPGHPIAVTLVAPSGETLSGVLNLYFGAEPQPDLVTVFLSSQGGQVTVPGVGLIRVEPGHFREPQQVTFTKHVVPEPDMGLLDGVSAEIWFADGLENDRGDAGFTWTPAIAFDEEGAPQEDMLLGQALPYLPQFLVDRLTADGSPVPERGMLTLGGSYGTTQLRDIPIQPQTGAMLGPQPSKRRKATMGWSFQDQLAADRVALVAYRRSLPDTGSQNKAVPKSGSGNLILNIGFVGAFDYKSEVIEGEDRLNGQDGTPVANAWVFGIPLLGISGDRYHPMVIATTDENGYYTNRANVFARLESADSGLNLAPGTGLATSAAHPAFQSPGRRLYTHVLGQVGAGYTQIQRRDFGLWHFDPDNPQGGSLPQSFNTTLLRQSVLNDVGETVPEETESLAETGSFSSGHDLELIWHIQESIDIAHSAEVRYNETVLAADIYKKGQQGNPVPEKKVAVLRIQKPPVAHHQVSITIRNAFGLSTTNRQSFTVLPPDTDRLDVDPAQGPPSILAHLVHPQPLDDNTQDGDLGTISANGLIRIPLSEPMATSDVTRLQDQFIVEINTKEGQEEAQWHAWPTKFFHPNTLEPLANNVETPGLLIQVNGNFPDGHRMRLTVKTAGPFKDVGSDATPRSFEPDPLLEPGLHYQAFYTTVGEDFEATAFSTREVKDYATWENYLFELSTSIDNQFEPEVVIYKVDGSGVLSEIRRFSVRNTPEPKRHWSNTISRTISFWPSQKAFVEDIDPETQVPGYVIVGNRSHFKDYWFLPLPVVTLVHPAAMRLYNPNDEAKPARGGYAVSYGEYEQITQIEVNQNKAWVNTVSSGIIVVDLESVRDYYESGDYQDSEFYPETLPFLTVPGVNQPYHAKRTNYFPWTKVGGDGPAYIVTPDEIAIGSVPRADGESRETLIWGAGGNWGEIGEEPTYLGLTSYDAGYSPLDPQGASTYDLTRERLAQWDFDKNNWDDRRRYWTEEDSVWVNGPNFLGKGSLLEAEIGDDTEPRFRPQGIQIFPQMQTGLLADPTDIAVMVGQEHGNSFDAVHGLMFAALRDQQDVEYLAYLHFAEPIVKVELNRTRRQAAVFFQSGQIKVFDVETWVDLGLQFKLTPSRTDLADLNARLSAPGLPLQNQEFLPAVPINVDTLPDGRTAYQQASVAFMNDRIVSSTYGYQSELGIYQPLFINPGFYPDDQLGTRTRMADIPVVGSVSHDEEGIRLDLEFSLREDAYVALYLENENGQGQTSETKLWPNTPEPASLDSNSQSKVHRLSFPISALGLNASQITEGGIPLAILRKLRLEGTPSVPGKETENVALGVDMQFDPWGTGRNEWKARDDVEHATGRVLFRHNEFPAVPTTGIELPLDRTYSNHGLWQGSLGRGWHAVWDSKAFWARNRENGQVTGQIQILMPDGEVVFAELENQTWKIRTEAYKDNPTFAIIPDSDLNHDKGHFPRELNLLWGSDVITFKLVRYLPGSNLGSAGTNVFYSANDGQPPTDNDVATAQYIIHTWQRDVGSDQLIGWKFQAKGDRIVGIEHDSKNFELKLDYSRHPENNRQRIDKVTVGSTTLIDQFSATYSYNDQDRDFLLLTRARSNIRGLGDYEYTYKTQTLGAPALGGQSHQVKSRLVEDVTIYTGGKMTFGYQSFNISSPEGFSWVAVVDVQMEGYQRTSWHNHVWSTENQGILSSVSESITLGDEQEDFAFSFDEYGRETSSTRNGSTWTNHWENWPQSLEFVNPMGVRTTTTYDTLRRIEKIEIQPQEAPSNDYTYVFHGNSQHFHKIRHKSGQVQIMEIDSSGRYTNIDDGLGQVSRYEDFVRGSSLAQKMTDELGMTERYSYDTLGRQTFFSREAKDAGNEATEAHRFKVITSYRPNGKTREYLGAHGLNYRDVYENEKTASGFRATLKTTPSDSISKEETNVEVYTPWGLLKSITRNGTVLYTVEKHGLGGPLEETPTWEYGPNASRTYEYTKTLNGYVPSEINVGGQTIWTSTYDSLGYFDLVTDHLKGLVSDFDYNDVGKIKKVTKSENGKALEEIQVSYLSQVHQIVTRNGIAYDMLFIPGQGNGPSGDTYAWQRIMDTPQGKLTEYGRGGAYHEVRGNMNHKAITRRMRRTGNRETVEQGQLPHAVEKLYTGDDRVFKLISANGVMSQKFTGLGEVLETRLGGYQVYLLTALDAFNRRTAWTSAGKKLTSEYYYRLERERKQGEKVLSSFADWDYLGRPQRYSVLDKDYQVTYTNGPGASETVTELGTGNFVRRTFDGLGRTIRKELNFPNRALYNVRWDFRFGRGLGVPGSSSEWDAPGDQQIYLSIAHDFGGLQREFEYDEFRRIKQVYSFGMPIDGNKRKAAPQRVQEITHTETNADGGQIVSVQGPEGFTSERHYNRNGDLLLVIENGLVLLDRDYDGQFRLIREEDYQGEVTTYLYEGKAVQPYLESHVAGDERWSTKFTYDDGQRLIEKVTRIANDDGVDSGGVHWRYEYDTFGRRTATYRSSDTDPEILWEMRSYDPVDGELVELTDASGLVWTMTYDENTGRMLTRTNTEGLSESWSYEDQGLTVTYQRTGAASVRTTYDIQGRVLERQVGQDKTWTYTYQPNGDLPASETAPDGRTIGRTFDDFGNLQTETFNHEDLTRSIQYQYDGLDRLKHAQSSDGQQLDLDYDGRGFLVSETWQLRNHLDPLVTRYDYDDRGNQTSVIFPSNRRLQRQFNQAGRITALLEGGHAQATFSYSTFGELLKIAQPGSTTTYNYDAYGRLASHTVEMMKDTPQASTRLETFGYGGSGGHPDNITSKQLMWGQLNLSEKYTYTKLNQIKEHEVLAVSGLPGMTPGKSTYHYTPGMYLERLETPYGEMSQVHNDDGSLHSRTFDGQTTTFQYDLAGRMLSETVRDDANGPNGYERHFEYDMTGMLSTLTERGPPAIEEVQEFEYDFFGRMRAQRNGSLLDQPWNVYTVSAPVGGNEAPLPIPSARGTITHEVLIPGNELRLESQVLGYAYGPAGLNHVTSFPTAAFESGRIAPQITDAGQNTIGMMAPHHLNTPPQAQGLATATFWDLWGNGLTLDVANLTDAAANPPAMSLVAQFNSEWEITASQVNSGELTAENLGDAGAAFASQARHKLIPGFAGKLGLGGFLTPDSSDPDASTQTAVTGIPRTQLAGLHEMDTRTYHPGTQGFTKPDQWAMFSTVGDPHSINRYQYANANPVMNWDPDGRLAALKMAMEYGSLPGNFNDLGYPEKAWAPSDFEAVLGSQAPLILDGTQFFLAIAELGTEIAALAVPHPAAKAALKAASFAFAAADLTISAMRLDAIGTTMGAVGMIGTIGSSSITAKTGKVVRAFKHLTELREFRHLSYALQVFGLGQMVAPFVFDGVDLDTVTGSNLGNQTLLLQATWLSSQSSTCFVEGTEIWTDDGPVAIESVQLGQRVTTEECDQENVSPIEIDPEHWRQVDLVIPSGEKHTADLHISLLRTVSWLEAQHTEEGSWVYASIPEMGVEGLAIVLNIGPCPPIEEGPGRLVLSTMQTQSDQVLELELDTGETLYITQNHLVYDLDHDEWVPAFNLRTGTSLFLREGAATVLGVTRLEGLYTVFNIEVEGTHNYYVGWEGLLSHNAKPVYVHFRGKKRNIKSYDFGKLLNEYIGPSPAGMYEPHAHHILFKLGNGAKQKALVKEGQKILRDVGIDPIFGKENLVWTPNKIVGQHDAVALKIVVDRLKEVRGKGGGYDEIVEALVDLGKISAARK